MPNAAGEGIEERDENNTAPDARNPGNQDNQPDEGPTMTPGGAMPSGGAMDHWATAMPNTDATKPETMPDSASEPLPGETEDRESV